LRRNKQAKKTLTFSHHIFYNPAAKITKRDKEEREREREE